MPPPRVQVAGVTLASMMHDMAAAQGDVEGLLFGSKRDEVTHRLQDDNKSSETSVTTICASCGMLTTLIPALLFHRVMGSVCSFYDTYGNVNAGALTGRTDPIIGWFRFRRDVPLRPTIRELSVHAQITKALGAPPGFPLIFALFTQKVGVEGTHSFDYRLYLVAGDRSLSAVDLSVTNLVHSSQAEYADFAVLSPATAFAGSLPNAAGVQQIERYISESQSELQQVAKTLSANVLHMRRLQEQVAELQRKAAQEGAADKRS